MSKDPFDIAIAGGGLVGASLACALAPLGFKVAVIEAVSPQAEQQPSYDDRTLALSQASCNILATLGLWDSLASDATPIRQVIVSELNRPGRVTLRAEEMGLDTLGHVVEARSFGHTVLDHLQGLESVEFICPARVISIDDGDPHSVLQLAGEPGEVAASLVVAADGAQSSLREMLGVSARGKDYGQTAVICNVTPERPHRGRAFERMTPTGPFAVLPHRGERCGMVWCVATADAQNLLDLPAEEFLLQASQRSSGELGNFVHMGKRSAYPLKLTVAGQNEHPRTLILGNAAHAVHPAGAQGFNLGLRDVAVLAEILAGDGGARPVADPGEPGLLDTYHEWRRPDQEATIAWTDGLVSLFASPLALSGVMRTLGLAAHGMFPALRRRMASQAMGYHGRVPRLARGEALIPGKAVAE